MHRSLSNLIARIGRPTAGWARTVLLCSALAGCADTLSVDAGGAAPNGGRATGGPGATSADAGSHAGIASADASGAQSGPAKSSGTAQPGGAYNAEDAAIGLKPGGAQDIAFFRQKLALGQLPKASDLTLEGFLNEHDTVLPAAAKDRVISLHALAGVFQAPGQAAEAVIQLGLNSAKKLDDVQTSLGLAVVVDRSGSMSGQKMADVKAGLHEMVAHLPKGTRVAILSFSDAVTTDFAGKVVAAADLPALHKAIDGITPSGGTNLYDGLVQGKVACLAAGAAFQNRRVLFLSDGVATVGNKSHAAIVAVAKQSAAEGCSVSTVGVGNNFDLPLMTEVAQVGNGTAWFVQNSDHAKQVFVQDLETMLLPVAEKLWMAFSLQQGWKVIDIPGFEWAIEGGKVTITGTKKATQPGAPKPDDPPPQPDPGGKVAMPTLFASKKNGIVMVRLQPPEGFAASEFTGLLLSTVEYGYQVAKTGAKESFKVPIQVPGIVQVPDGGMGYFESPIVRRTYAILRVGLDLIDACKLAEAGQADAAKAVVAASQKFLASQVAAGGAELKAVDQSQPDLADAASLLAALGALIK